MKLLAAHNTLTAYSHKGFIFNKKSFLKCQSKKVGDLFYCGVRVFDIRIRVINNKIYVSHGGQNYNVNVENIISYINNLPDPIYVRLVNEDTVQKSDKKQFIEISEKWMAKYKNIIWQIVTSKKNWFVLYDFFPNYTEHICYWKIGLQPQHPKPYANKFNNQNLEDYRKCNEDSIWWFDFI